VTVAAVALAFLVVSAAVGVLTYLMAGGNPGLSTQVVSLLNRSVGTDSTRFAVGRVSGTLFRGAVLDHPRLVVLTPEGEVTWASARRVRIDYDLFGIVFSKNRSLTAVIDSPMVRLVHDRSGRMVVPRFARRPARRGTGPTTRVLVSARNGSVSFDWQRLRFKQVQGRGLLTLAPGRSTLALDELSGLPDPSERARGRVRAKGTILVADGSLRSDALSLDYGDSKILARVAWDLAKGRVSDALFTLSPLRIGDVSRLAGAEKLDGRLRGEISFSGLPTDGKGTACLAGEVNGEPLDTLAVTAAFAPRSVTLSGLRVRVRRAEATGGGTVQFGGPAQAALTFHGLDPAAVPWWKAPAGMPQGSLSGTARVLMRPTRPKRTLVALVALGQSRFGRLDVRQGSLALGTGADGSAVLDSGWVDVPGGRLSGRARITGGRTLDAHVVLAIENLASMNSLIAPVAAESGRGRITADLTGDLRSPDFTARAALAQGRLTSGIAYDSLRMNASGKLGDGGSARATLAASGIRAGERALGQAAADLSIGKSIVIERYVQSSGDSTLAFRGTVTLGQPESHAVLDSVALNAGALRFHNTEPVRLTIGEGHVRTSSLALDIRPGRFEVAFDWDVKGSRIDAQGAFQGLEVARLSGAAPSRGSLRGVAHGRFRVNGAWSDPAVSLDAGVLGPSFAGVDGDSLALAAQYTPGHLRIDGARWAGGDGRVSAGGSIRSPVPLETWLQAIARKDQSWARTAALALDVRVDAFDLSRLAPADTSLRSLAGTASLTAQVSGSAQEPVIAMRGSAPRIAYRGLEGSVTGAEIAYSGQTFHIIRGDVSQGGSLSSVTGDVPMDFSFFGKDRLLRDRPLHLTFRVSDADFRLLTVIYPAYVAASGGKISIMAGVSGTPRTPAVQGTVRLKDAMIRLAGREEVVQKIELEGAFDQNQLTVTKMEGVQGTKGRIAGIGTWQWGGLDRAAIPVAAGPPGRYQFKVNAQNFTVTDRETYLMQLTGTFSIANGRTEDGRQIPMITGAATLAKGNLTLDLAGPRQEFTLPFYYDVNVEVPGGLFYRTVDSEVELQGTLRLVNQGEGNLALGTMTVRKGRYYLFTREIRNLSGDFIFSSLDRTDPELAVDGETVVPSSPEPVTIKVSLTGRASRPVVRLWDPRGTYSEADLWQKLTYGQVFSGSDPDGTDAGNGTSPELSPFIQAYLFRNAERWLTESGWIDTFDLRTGARTGGATGTGSAGTSGVSGNGPLDIGLVGAGKYVTRDLYVNYSREFSGSEAQRIGAEYRVTRHLLLKGERTDRFNATPNLPAQEYNLDLKVRLEY
jgi:autotransporter translocation and assembly factor TamB